MKRVISLVVLAAQMTCANWSAAVETEKDVSWRAQAEIARRGAMVERIDGIEDALSPQSAMALAMQPPADDSHKWLFTLVTTRNCQLCEQARRDFDNDARFKAWVDTKDYTNSWAHWQVIQIDDQSQAWRWKDFRPKSFPCLIVQPPVNGSWGDPHTIVFAHQGYLKPAELDAAVRKAIQQYAAKVLPRRRALETVPDVIRAEVTPVSFQQARPDDAPGGWNPPVTPPSPLPPVPNYPSYPNVPPVSPSVTPDLGSLLVQFLGSLLGGSGTANLLLVAILAWQVYRSFAKREGIPLLLDDAGAAQLIQILQSAARPKSDPPSVPTVQVSRTTPAA